MAEITRIYSNIRRQFFFVITTAASTRCLVQNFQLICYSQLVNATSQYEDSGSLSCSKWPKDRMVAVSSIKNCIRVVYPDDSKPLVRSQSFRKLASKLLGIRGSRRESKRKQRVCFLRGPAFRKARVHFLFSPFPYSGALNLGKIYANLSREIVTSSSVLDHRDKNKG